MSDSRSVYGMFNSALRHVLALHLLPELSAQDIGSLACTCRSGHELVLQASPAHWRNLALQILPARHPVQGSQEVRHLQLACLKGFCTQSSSGSLKNLPCESKSPRKLVLHFLLAKTGFLG